MQNGSARPINIPVTHSWSNSHSPVNVTLKIYVILSKVSLYID